MKFYIYEYNWKQLNQDQLHYYRANQMQKAPIRAFPIQYQNSVRKISMILEVFLFELKKVQFK